MLVLGTTADDKGAQLEALVHVTLTADGYQDIRRNEIREGGNELDVVARRVSPVLGGTQVTQVICEAKAYADAVSSPNWQRFLGKLLLARSEDPSALGVLIALNGVNGNVSGSYHALRTRDHAVLIIDGLTLENRARDSGELVSSDGAEMAVMTHYHRKPSRVEAAFYDGAWRWIARWGVDEYSVIGGRGELLSAEVIEQLRPALEASISGQLATAADAQVAAESRHSAWLTLLNDLLYGVPVVVPSGNDPESIEAELAAEEFCISENGQVRLQDPKLLEAAAVCQLFRKLFQNSVSVKQLAFLADRLLDSWINRLVEVLPITQSGFTLDSADDTKLRALTPLFPSVMVLLATPIEFFSSHDRAAADGVDSVLDVDRNAFWEMITHAIQSDFVNPALRGFLYEHLGVAELAEIRSVRIKTRSGPIATVDVEIRNAIGQLTDEFAEEAGIQHMIVRLLPEVGEPWEDQKFPEPSLELIRPTGFRTMD
ncbi:hypothetical protein HRK28_19100 [Rathayibacter sp. VKM Ac-2835]|uniref:hypothetical protein n=1 Tax=Rathayibacter sp. VKM Ac-2835 TaxID=2739043 RepID=UPI0015661027|nr:hypothetical protein [Rathayibacter sp. VKM Ac-2835]NRG43020.1 hypothetical protein [Rathayibacter sp. VKM Ac-2835]